MRLRNPHPELRIRNFCIFGGNAYQVISLEAREDVSDYANTLRVMDKWIIETLGEH